MGKLGKPLPKINEVIPPSQEEEDKAIARWNANCPPFYRGLLEAQSINEPNPTAAFLYDRFNGHYVHRKTGRILTQREIRDAFIVYSRNLTSK